MEDDIALSKCGKQNERNCKTHQNFLHLPIRKKTIVPSWKFGTSVENDAAVFFLAEKIQKVLYTCFNQFSSYNMFSSVTDRFGNRENRVILPNEIKLWQTGSFFRRVPGNICFSLKLSPKPLNITFKYITALKLIVQIAF